MFSRKNKVFCIGHNKTGTTSLSFAMEALGYKVGRQRTAEEMLDAWCARDFSKITRYCKTADFFQDVPFSLPYLYVALDQAFPGARFILTVRENAGSWYESTCNFHQRIVGKGRLPTYEDLQQYDYCRPGWLLQLMQEAYGVEKPEQLYDKDLYEHYYLKHNSDVLDYFRNRKDDLLILNVADDMAMAKLCEFLGLAYSGQKMPHMNKRKN